MSDKQPLKETPSSKKPKKPFVIREAGPDDPVFKLGFLVGAKIIRRSPKSTDKKKD